jgi:acetyl-CoA C-acetyltransferase
MANMRRLSTVFHKEVIIAAAKRSPFGCFMGSLSKVSATTLGAHAVKSLVESSFLLNSDIEAVIQGVALLAGTGACPARQVALASGFSPTTPCTTVTMGCASGMFAIALAAQQVAAGHLGCVAAGGFESMSQTPFYQMNLRGGQLLGHSSNLDGILKDGLICPVNGVPLGSVAEKTISEFGISSYDQGSYAEDSYIRAAAAWDRSFFSNEIAPVTLSFEGKDPKSIQDDEEPRKVDYEKFKNTKPLYDPAGTITALTSASINDGAASVLLLSSQKAKSLKLAPLAYIRACSHVATTASNFSLAVANAIDELLKSTGTPKEDVQQWEICETFASIPLVTMNVLGLDHKTVNINGGALSLGHPLGASGARQVVTLAHSMKERNFKRGVAAICSAGGEGLAVLLEL